MQLILALGRRAPREILLLAALGFLSGISSAALIAAVERLTRVDRPELWLIAVFAGAVVARLFTTVGSNLLLVRFAQDTVLQLSRDLVGRVLQTPFRRIEELGANRIIAVMTDDVAVLSAAIVAIPTVTVNAAVLVGCSIYLGWLSPLAFLTLVLLGTVGAVSYRILLRKAHAAILRAREGRDRLFAVFRSATDGVKELQLHRARRESFVHEEVDSVTAFLKEQNLIAMRQYAKADAWTQIVFYGVLAMILFGLGSILPVPRATTSAYVFAALYCMTPVWGLVATLPTFDRGHAAWERINQLGESLVSASATPGGSKPQPAPRLTPPAIEFESVVFTYPGRGSEPGFSLGPLDFALRPGELTFIVGGNGSGKSTLVKLLTGLYAPTAGRVLVDGRSQMTSDDSYRELFSVVFSDFYLFEQLHGFTAAQLEEQAPRYLSTLGLERKVSLEGNRLSTTSLSTGQRRRLALLTAYLEDRPVYVLDEWAADQDPLYRRIFYEELLPELQRRGKTVVVITHDDRYFHLATQLLKLDSGRIVRSGAPRAAGAAADATGDAEITEATKAVAAS
jgi:putative ATP-binding cassette transporter